LREIWIDYLRVIAAIAVIIIHVTAGFLINSNTGTIDWWIGLYFDGAMRFCVPLFVMISGSLLLSKRYSLKDHLKKRFQKVLLPFIFWSIIYILYDLIFPVLKGDSIYFMPSLKYITSGLFFGVRGHLWYVYMILGLYLFIPYLQKWTSQYKKNEMYLFLSLWSVTLIVNWFISSAPGAKGYSFVRGFDLSYFSGFVGYLVLGFFLYKNNFLNNKMGNFYLICLIVLGLMITYFGTYYISKPTGLFKSNFFRYLTPNVAMVSIGLFLLFKNNFNKIFPQRLINSVLQNISKYSYGIYLSHVFVLGMLRHIGINRHFINPLIGTISTTTSCLLLSLIITIIINKLPFGKFVSG